MSSNLRICALVAGFVALLFPEAATLVARQAQTRSRVTWGIAELTVTALQGTSRRVPLSFRVSSDTANVSFSISPTLSGLVQPIRAVAPILRQQDEHQIALDLSIGTAVNPGIYQGTLHLRSGASTIPTPLALTVVVAQPDAQSVPEGPTAPSADRVSYDDQGRATVADEIVVVLDTGTIAPAFRASQIAAEVGAVLIGSVADVFAYQFRFKDVAEADLAGIVTRLKGFPDVTEAVRSYLGGSAAFVPDDYSESENWSESDPSGDNWNLEYIRAPTAWERTTGSRFVEIGIIDIDIDPRHSDLVNNVSSVLGSRGPVIDIPGHGSHVSGIACAEGNNRRGIAGVAWQCSLKLFDEGRYPYFSPLLVVADMIDAAGQGARIVNISLDFLQKRCAPSGVPPEITPTDLTRITDSNTIFGKGIEAVVRKRFDVLWVFAAGNACVDARNASPAGVAVRYPSNTIAVASVTRSGVKSLFSNYGDLVSVAAPGGDGSTLSGRGVFSTLSQNCGLFGVNCSDRYGYMSGTSQAAPHVTGLAALVLSAHPTFSSAAIRLCIVRTAQLHGRAVPNHLFRTITAPEAVECSEPPADPITVFTDEGLFSGVVHPNSRTSFNMFPVGTVPAFMRQGLVAFSPTNSPSAFATTLTETTDGFWNDSAISVGFNLRTIVGYNGTTKSVTLSQPLPSTPPVGTSLNAFKLQLTLGTVGVTLTQAGGAIISGPGPFGFATNFLSSGVQDNSNNVLLTFPAGTGGVGMSIAAPSSWPLSIVVTDFAGRTLSVPFQTSGLGFLGFDSTAGIRSVRVSSPVNPNLTPIVNIGDIRFLRR